jgi:hypothetical protein
MRSTLGTQCAGRLQEANFCSFYETTDHESTRGNEKRRSIRLTHEEPVILETQEGQLFGAVMMNYGKNGLYFESDLNARRGTILRIRNESTLASRNGGGCCAEVRWSKPLGGSPTEYAFGTGVRYC